MAVRGGRGVRTTTDYLQHLQGRVACLIADRRDALAIRRPAWVAPVERAKRQWQWRGTIGRGQPQLLFLSSVVAGEQQLVAIG